MRAWPTKVKIITQILFSGNRGPCETGESSSSSFFVCHNFTYKLFTGLAMMVAVAMVVLLLAGSLPFIPREHFHVRPKS